MSYAAEDSFQNLQGETVLEETDDPGSEGDHFFEGDVELFGWCADEVDACGVELDAEHLGHSLDWFTDGG